MNRPYRLSRYSVLAIGFLAVGAGALYRSGGGESGQETMHFATSSLDDDESWPSSGIGQRSESAFSSEPAESPAEFNVVEVEEFWPVDLKILHANQRHDAEQILYDPNASVEGLALPETRRELDELHRRQQASFSSLSGSDIVIAASDAGDPALSVADIRALHQRQSESSGAAAAGAAAVPGFLPGNQNFSPERLSELHAQQKAAIGDTADPVKEYAAPLPTTDDVYLMVEEVHDLQRQQILE